MKTASLFALLFALCSPAYCASAKASYEHYLKALLLSNQGGYDAALQEYEKAVELDPQSAFVLQQAAELAMEMGRLDKAQAFAVRLSSIAPESTEAALLQGHVSWAVGDLPAAQSSFERVLARSGAPAEASRRALFALGSLLSAQSPEKAKKYFERTLASNPENASEVEYQLALIEHRARHFDDAAKHLQRSVELDPDDMQARYTLAQTQELRRDTAAALGVYADILQRDPRNVGLLDRVGELYFMQDDFARAKEHFLRAKIIAPDHPATCLWLSLLAEQEQDFASAAKNLKESAGLKDDASLHLRLGYYLTQAGRLAEAVEALESAHKHWPENEEVSYFLSLGYDDLKKTDKAVALLRELLRAVPDNRDARFQLGAIFERDGKMPQAEEQFREILKKNPADAPALNYLGYSLADRGLKLEESEGMLRKAVELDPKSGAYRDSLGWVRFKRGAMREGLSDLQEAARLLPDDDTVLDHLGEAYSVLGDTAAAWSAWRAAQSAVADMPKRAEDGRRPLPGYGKKAEAAAKKLLPEQLGALELQSFARQRGGFSRFAAPCILEGTLLGKSVRLQALLRYREPYEMSLEVLGPLFSTLFKAAFTGPEAFESDPLSLPGVPEPAVRDALLGVLSAARGYLSGRIFERRPVLHRSSWRGQWVETPEIDFYGDENGRLREARFSTGLKLSFEDYRRREDRVLPMLWIFEGKGFSLRLRLAEPQAMPAGAQVQQVVPAGAQVAQ
ncbi:MAG: tetratricopeptide repeat protein [Elusimicrobiota bacterium]